MELIYKGAFFWGGHPIYEHFNPHFDHKNQQNKTLQVAVCIPIVFSGPLHDVILIVKQDRRCLQYLL